MKHSEIDASQIVEHYVAGKLGDEDAARFEEHYLSCPECVRAVEDAERLRCGLELAAAEELTARQTVFAAALHALRSGPGALLLSLVLIVALLPVALAWQRTARLDAELDRARGELAAERLPRSNTPILALVATRAGEQPLQRISLAPEPEWIVLAVELGDDTGERYEAALTDSSGRVVLRMPDLVPSFNGTVSLSLHSSLLPPDTYVLSLADGDRELRFPLEIVVRTTP